MIKELYLAIEQKLMAVTDEQPEPQPLFKHFDLWNRQVEFIEEETPFETPAIFVEFMPIPWETLGQNIQEANLTLHFHIVTPWYANTAANTANVRDAALAYLDIPTVLFRQLHGQHGSFPNRQGEKPMGSFNSLTRVRSLPNHNHEKFVDSIEEYTCHLKDLSFGLRTVPVDTVGLSIEFEPHPGQPM